MEIVPSKAAMTLTGPNWRWLHEEAWDDYHRVFASECVCFFFVGPHRNSWLSPGGRRLPPHLNCGYQRAGRWLLESTEDKSLHMGAQLQWEDGIFSRAWLAISESGGAIDFDDEKHPLNWLVDALYNRLRPDLLTLSGDIPYHFQNSFELTKIIAPRAQDLKHQESVLKIEPDKWKSWPLAHLARQELSWVRRRVEREEKEEARLATPKKRPFLIRLLVAMSPIRRMRREKMIHPLTRYRNRDMSR